MVENQATDRAFRIGQTQNVMVHKLVCDGASAEKKGQTLEPVVIQGRTIAKNWWVKAWYANL